MQWQKLAVSHSGAKMTLSSDGIFSERDWNRLAGELGMSGRQHQITRDLFLGMSDKQIATELSISVATVRTHLGRMFTKYNVQDRSELILLCVRHFHEQCKDCRRHQH